MPAVIGKGRQIPFGLTRGTSEQLSAIAGEHVRASVLLPYSSQRNESLCASKAPASAFQLFPEKLNYHSSQHENLEKFQFKACKGHSNGGTKTSQESDYARWWWTGSRTAHRRSGSSCHQRYQV